MPQLDLDLRAANSVNFPFIIHAVSITMVLHFSDARDGVNLSWTHPHIIYQIALGTCTQHHCSISECALATKTRAPMGGSCHLHQLESMAQVL